MFPGQVEDGIRWAAVIRLRTVDPVRAQFQDILPARRTKWEALHTSAQRLACFDDLETVYTSLVQRLSSHDTSNTASKDKDLEVASRLGDMALLRTRGSNI